MSLWPSVLLSLARTLLVVGLAIPAAAPIARRLRGERSNLWWAGVLAPLLVPELLTGYGWSNFSLSLAAKPWANEALTAALIWGRCVCAAAALLAVAPPSTRTASAVFLRKLVFTGTPRPRGASALQAWMREGALRAIARFGPAAGVAGLFAFGQFEVPSLAGVKTWEPFGWAGQSAWTVALFDAHADMQSLAGSLRLALPAVLVQLVGLIPLLIWLRRSGERGPGDERQGGASRGSLIAASAVLAAAAGLTVLVPAGVLAWETGLQGWTELAASEWRLSSFAEELGLSLAVGAAAAALAGSVLWAAGHVRGPAGTALIALLIAPGLCGPLVAGLIVKAGVTFAAANDWPGGRVLQESFLPLIVAVALFLLPRAALLRAFAPGHGSGAFLAGLLRNGTRSQRRAGGRIWWGLTGRSTWVRWGLLTLWGGADVSAAALLTPAGYQTAPHGLYNLMHYGHNAVLGALCLLNTVAPAVLLALGAWAAPRGRALRGPAIGTTS
ncbi:hypothetical protein [Alienimonas chondri]|uniref:ABC transmembrane type-1 domain-containing protein n=1 Tax=Alienimonas chondri TaxID=2681879 RepID=A0ABX1VCE3_9PLAN|nr:hypothetical protein [Alienimonas chondri]NNJ25616.1 hypothetical protein [Alienimonas chondri]